MNTFRWFLSAWAAGLAALSVSAASDDADTLNMHIAIPCATGEAMTRMLHKFGERRLAKALDVSDAPMILQVNPDTGTFSILLLRPDGLSCILAAGNQFLIVGHKPTVPGQSL